MLIYELKTENTASFSRLLNLFRKQGTSAVHFPAFLHQEVLNSISKFSTYALLTRKSSTFLIIYVLVQIAVIYWIDRRHESCSKCYSWHISNGHRYTFTLIYNPLIQSFLSIAATNLLQSGNNSS